MIYNGKDLSTASNLLLSTGKATNESAIYFLLLTLVANEKLEVRWKLEIVVAQDGVASFWKIRANIFFRKYWKINVKSCSIERNYSSNCDGFVVMTKFCILDRWTDKRNTKIRCKCFFLISSTIRRFYYQNGKY